MIQTDWVGNLPLFVVVSIQGDHLHFMCGQNDETKTPGVLLFTEELYAERCRDKWPQPNKRIDRFETKLELREFAANVLRYNPLRWFAIDARHDDKGGAYWLPIQDLLDLPTT